MKKEKTPRTNIDMDLASAVEAFSPQPQNENQRKAAAKAKERRIIEAWVQAMPQEIIDHSDNIYLFKEGHISRLVIYVDSGIWAAELGTQKYTIQHTMQNLLHETIDVVDIYPSSLNHQKSVFENKQHKKKEAKDATPSASLTQQEIAAIKKQMPEIENQQLKEALFNARIKDKEWKKGLKAQKSR